MLMTLTNNEIYDYSNNLSMNFSDENQKFPIKVNFYLQKNIKELFTLAQEIEEKRIEIAKKYGTLDASGQQYTVPEDKVEQASKELKDLFDILQDVKIYKVKLEDFGDVELTAAQMQALLFMIDEEE